MPSMDIKVNVDTGNIGKIYRNDQGVLERKMLSMDVGRIPEFDPESEYKECEMIEKFRKDFGVESSSLLCKEFQCNVPYNSCIKPSLMYFFANLNDIRIRTEIEHNIENNTCTFKYKKPSGGPSIKVVVTREDVGGGLMGIRKVTEDYAINEIAKRYDDMMCRRYFNMNAVDFRNLSDKVVRLGGRIELNDGFGFMNVAGPLVTIQLPCDKLDRLKIENELVYQHAMMPSVPAVEKIVTHNDRVTIVYFVDGTFTKCVCGKDEDFNLYTGVAFCLFKKMLSRGGDDGHKKFNSMMHKAMKTIEDEEKLQKMIKQAKHEEKLREAKRLEKKRRKEFKKKEEQIRIMQEALRRDREAANLENTTEAFKPDC